MSITLENISRRYDRHAVVNRVSLQVENGELFVLLGSSGSGKTTVLSLIAGLIPLSEGRILLNGRDVTDLPPQERQVGYVFQNYALFQHMTIAENVEFGLSVRKVSKERRRQRREELLELVGLAGLGNRLPRQLSGGQQQRVALARALAHEPAVLLLDEPLGALDAKIRVELRRTLRLIQQRLQITTILVTHDQEEAFDLADRMGVMSFGRLLEVGTPQDLYQQPQTEFVASFLGVANLLVGKTAAGGVKIGEQYFPQKNGLEPENEGRRVQVLFRPEDVALADTPERLGCPPLGQAEVQEISFGGPVERLLLSLPPIPGVRPIAPSVPFGSNTLLVEASRGPEQTERLALQSGDRVWAGIHRLHTLTHPGLNLLLVTDSGPRREAVFAFGGEIARLAHARVTLLGCEQPGRPLNEALQEARKQMVGSVAALEVQISQEPVGRAVQQVLDTRPYDLVVLGFSAEEHLHLVENILQVGEHHVLLLPAALPVPERALICVASGEPGKDDILFAGRLIRHFGGQASLLSVMGEDQGSYPQQRERIQRFLEKGRQSLELLGVPAQSSIRTGNVSAEILRELQSGAYGLLVIGVPLANTRGEISLAGPVRQMLTEIKTQPILIVRSAFAGVRNLKTPGPL